MISVVISINKECRTIELHVNGHADSGEYGHDIICASASILTYSFAGVIDRFTPKLLKEPRIELKEGEAIITCQAKTSDDFAELLNKSDVVRTGFELLTDNYPEHVRIKVFGETY